MGKEEGMEKGGDGGGEGGSGRGREVDGEGGGMGGEVKTQGKKEEGEEVVMKRWKRGKRGKRWKRWWQHHKTYCKLNVILYYNYVFAVNAALIFLPVDIQMHS